MGEINALTAVLLAAATLVAELGIPEVFSDISSHSSESSHDFDKEIEDLTPSNPKGRTQLTVE